MEPVRVAQIMGKMLYGGTESVVMNYYRHIDRDKIQFDFIADSDSKMPIPRREEIESLGGRVFIVPPYQNLNKYVPALIRLFKEQKYQIVHVHLNTLNVFSLYAAKRAGVPVRISHSHSTAAKGELKKNVLKYILRPFSKVYPTQMAACSYYAGEWLFGKKKIEQGKVTIFPNAIELDKYKYDETVRAEVRKELGVENKFVIGHVGRFCFQKNQDFLIDIFEKIYEQNPNVVLLMIGDGEDMERIKEKVKQYMENSAVQMPGTCMDVRRLYQAMDVFVLPSRYEGLPVVGVEAQASGLPCVMSDQVSREAKILETTVFVSPNVSLDDWTSSILRLAENGARKNTAKEMRKAGFDITIEARKLEEFYMKLLEGNTENSRGGEIRHNCICSSSGESKIIKMPFAYGVERMAA